MKISRKMKKFFVSILTATLSIIMFVTQASAANLIYYVEYFEHEGVVDTIECMSWMRARNLFSFSVDLICYECDNVDIVYASAGCLIDYRSSLFDNDFSDAIWYFEEDDFTYLDTDDSDEIDISISNFDLGFEMTVIAATVTYEIHYDNGDKERYVFTHTASLIDGELIDHDRDPVEHVYIFFIEDNDK